jgi:hypothetical protein
MLYFFLPALSRLTSSENKLSQTLAGLVFSGDFIGDCGRELLDGDTVFDLTDEVLCIDSAPISAYKCVSECSRSEEEILLYISNHTFVTGRRTLCLWSTNG